jgi:hypothetical protein
MRGSAFIQRGKNFEVYDELFVTAPPRSKGFCFCGLVLSYRVKQAAKRQV